MLPAERHIKIIEIISETGSAGVEELANLLNVSSMTIRRDLKLLQEHKLLERSHGGAIIKQEINYGTKRDTKHKEKVAIAKKCAEFVKKGDIIYLDAGTTTYEIANQIKNIEDLTVITNDLEIALLLVNSDIDLFVCGGNVQKSTRSMYGVFANKMIENFRINLGFFGAMSIDKSFDILTPTMEKASFKKTVFASCQQTILGIDDSKFNKKSLLKINNLSEYTGVVTNKKFSKEEFKEIKSFNIRLIVV